MNIFLILAHPERQSFNGAMFDAARETFARQGHSVVTSDLYRMGFDPASGRKNFTGEADPAYFKQQFEEAHATTHNGFAADVETELKKLESADLMIWQFPLWWFSVPAILKGWVDRVFASGRTYGGGRYYDKGVFTGRRAMLSLTTGGTFAEAPYDDRSAALLMPIHSGMLRFVGFDVLRPQIVRGPARGTDAERAAAIANYARRLENLAQETPIPVAPLF
jgi:NAD(P)H dehydrogenase (quinone)